MATSANSPGNEVVVYVLVRGRSKISSEGVGNREILVVLHIEWGPPMNKLISGEIPPMKQLSLPYFVPTPTSTHSWNALTNTNRRPLL